jgi:septum site-determining protein MinD
VESGSIISILSRKGGVGRSFIAVNLAVAIRKMSRGRVLLIDLNLPFSGDCLMQLGLSSATSMTHYAPRIDFLTAAALEAKIATHKETGVAVLPACVKVELSRLVTADVVKRFIEVTQPMYSYIVVDHGSEITEQTMAVLDRNTLSLLVSNQNILSVGQTRKLSDLLRAVHYPAERVHYVVNRYAQSSRITESIIQSNVDKPILGFIPEDAATVEEGLMSGQPVLRNKRLAVSLAIEDLAEKVLYHVDRLASTREHGVSTDFLATAETADPAVKRGADGAEMIALKVRVHQRLVREMSTQEFAVGKVLSGKELAEVQMKAEAVVSRILDDEDSDLVRSADAKRSLTKEILDEALGLGPLEKYLADSKVSEIMINGAAQIYIESAGKLVLAPERFTSEDQLRRIIERIVLQVGRRVDEQSPLVDARLLDGSRINAVIPPVALDGSKLTIRKFSKKKLGVDDLLTFGTLNKQMAQFLQAAILSRKNIVISGGTGSGKTTLLNILSSYIPTDERIVTIEDSAELQLPQEHVVRLETRPMNIEGRGEITIRDLVRNALRMRPDRIVIGECRGGEALDMLQAMNTGHDGSLTTAHANTPNDTLSRLETMCLMSGMELPSKAIREQIASAVHLIVQQSRLQDGSRKITHITEVLGIDAGNVTTQDLFLFHQRGVGADGRVAGFFSPTGNIPTFLDEVASKGIGVNREIFLQQRV